MGRSADGSKPDPTANSNEETKSEKQKRKTAVTCAECGTGYAAEKWSDGKILLIGRRTGCQCGATEFEELDDSEREKSTPRTKAD